MEIKAALKKPYEEKERLDFIVENNYNLGYEIKEVEEGLQAWGYTQEELDKQKKEEIANLKLTAADVERALVKALDTDFDDILLIVKTKYPDKYKMTKAELKANYFYRGNPYVDLLGQEIGLTTEQLDNFFIRANNEETKEVAWEELKPIKTKEGKTK